MFVYAIIFSFLLIVRSEINNNDGFCDLTEKKCEIANSDLKFLFYDINPPEGFNLRRDVYMRFAIMLAESQKNDKRLNWRLVLPPWYRLYHWKTEKHNKALPWSAFFDVQSLKSYAPVVELHEVFSQLKTKQIELDHVYVLKNYENAFEDGVFNEKWETADECDFDTSFWGYKNITTKEVECVSFQGKISNLWELIMLHPSDHYVMVSHGEIPLHDTYGTKPYWDCRKSMIFNEDLIKTAKNFMSQFLKCKIDKCTTYIAVHWRRQDFAYSRHKDIPSILGTAKQIHETVENNIPYVKKVFIATDAAVEEVNILENVLKNHGYNVYFYKPNKRELDVFKDGGIAIIEQIICSHAAYFLGTHESTYTFRIQEEREILGFNSRTTFNRLCPDTGKCEKPSKWTIVH